MLYCLYKKILFRIIIVLFPTLLSTTVLAIEALEEGEGYILIALNIERGYIPSKVTLSGEGWGNNLQYENLRANMNYWLEPVSAGTYQWDRLYLSKRSYLDVDEQNYKIKVEAGKINYAGHLSLYTEMSKYRDDLTGGARYYFNNRSSKAQTFLESNFAELLNKYKIVYSGHEKDHFFNYVSQLKGEE